MFHQNPFYTQHLFNRKQFFKQPVFGFRIQCNSAVKEKHVTMYPPNITVSQLEAWHNVKISFSI